MQILIGSEKLSKHLGSDRFGAASRIVNWTQYIAFGLLIVGGVLYAAFERTIGLATFVRMCGVAFIALGLTLCWGDISPVRYSKYSVESVPPGRRWVAVMVGIAVLLAGGGLFAVGIMMLFIRL